MRGIRGFVAVAALAFASAGCSGSSSVLTPGSTPSATVAPEATQGPVHAESVDGHFKLAVDLPRRIWRTSEPITGKATLSISGIDSLDIMASSGGPFVYRFERVDRAVNGFNAGTPDLRQTTLTSASPIVGALPGIGQFLWSSGSGSPSAGAFGPADWTLSVEAVFLEATGEPRTEHRLRTSVTLRVASDAPPSSEASLGPTRVETSEGPVHLVVELPKLVWSSGETLSGTATLSLDGVDQLDIMTSGMGPLMFQLRRVDGTVRGGAPVTADLGPMRLLASKPLVQSIPPIIDFNLATIPWKLVDPAPTPFPALTPGDWTLTVLAEYLEGTDASTAIPRTFEASVTFRVVP